jgi:hypothetical protein
MSETKRPTTTDPPDRPFLARFAVRLDAEAANEDATAHASSDSATGTTRKTGVGNETTDDD